jgi:hypothetical protein
VHSLHCIDFVPFTNAYFSLTQKMKGVKQTRSLTCSSVYLISTKFGTQANHADSSQGEAARLARIQSKGLVERTGTIVEGNIESRSVELVLRLAVSPEPELDRRWQPAREC